MTTAILFQGKTGEADLKHSLDQLSKTKNINWLLIGNAAPAGLSLKLEFVSCNSCSLPQVLATALEKTSDSSLIFIDAACPPSPSAIEALSSNLPGNVNILPLKVTSPLPAWTEPSAAALAPLLASGTTWPLCAVAVSKETLSLKSFTAASPLEAMVQIIIQNIGLGKKPRLMKEPADSCLSPESCKLSVQATARCLQLAVDSCNIETLFPDHPWGKHQQESAAASYHSLAAMFLKLEDLNACSECLRLADKFEDSPRSLALKGMLAARRSEVLGAVANMIASLQLYEQRKRNDDGSHYLCFNPADIEAVNKDLATGLSALNQQDNSTALQHFTAAVFDFDSFFKEHGLSQII